jgi:uncharacterized membrane protein
LRETRAGSTIAEACRNDTRGVVLGHALLSYLFGTGLIAMAVSLVTNLGS